MNRLGTMLPNRLLSYRSKIPFGPRLLLTLVYFFGKKFNINALFVLRNRTESITETVILKDAAGKEVGWRNYPHIPRVKRIRVCLEKAGKILAGPSRNAYSLGTYGSWDLVKLCEP